MDPDNWTIDSALLARPGVDEIMLDLLYDVRNNGRTVADARQFFKAHQRQVMIATSVNDPLFPGASMKPPADMAAMEFHPSTAVTSRLKIIVQRSGRSRAASWRG
jgi:hypothetical protein